MNIILQAPNGQPDFWSGFTIETEDNGLGGGYLLKKGTKEYSLIRNQHKPSMMFLLCDFVMIPKIKGVEWFKEVIEGDNITIVPMS